MAWQTSIPVVNVGDRILYGRSTPSWLRRLIFAAKMKNLPFYYVAALRNLSLLCSIGWWAMEMASLILPPSQRNMILYGAMATATGDTQSLSIPLTTPSHPSTLKRYSLKQPSSATSPPVASDGYPLTSSSTCSPPMAAFQCSRLSHVNNQGVPRPQLK